MKRVVLEHLGRKDFQVKIRGMRVELAEIETVLEEHAGVRRAVVALHDTSSHDKRLVCYIVPREKMRPSKSELRKYLRIKLPEYMVPSIFVWLEELALTPSGKVDRLRLPEPRPVDCEGTYLLPRTPIEKILAEIWAEVLGVSRVGVQDTFNELGGHSLLIPRLHAQIQKVFGKALPFAALLQAPTVEQLAEILRQDEVPPQWSSLVVVQPHGTRAPFFCAHGFAGYPHLAKHLGLEQPFYGLVQGLDGKKFFTRVEEIAAAYIKELRIVQPDGPYFLGGHSFGGLVAFEMAQQLRRQGQEIALLALLDPVKPSSGMSPSAAESRWSGSFRSWASISSKISRHSKNLGELPAQAKGTYILSLLKIVLNQISHTARQTVCEGYLALGVLYPPH